MKKYVLPVCLLSISILSLFFFLKDSAKPVQKTNIQSETKIGDKIKMAMFCRIAKEEDFTSLYGITDPLGVKLGQSTYGFHASGGFKNISSEIREKLFKCASASSSNPELEPSWGSLDLRFVLYDEFKNFITNVIIFKDQNFFGVRFMVGSVLVSDSPDLSICNVEVPDFISVSDEYLFLEFSKFAKELQKK